VKPTHNISVINIIAKQTRDIYLNAIVGTC
jgi:hypothetical protein